MGTDQSKTDDGTGTIFFQKLLALAKQGGGYLEYRAKRPGFDEQRFPKITYARFFPNWKWMVASDVYMNEIRAEILYFKLMMLGALLGVLGLSSAA